VKKMNLVWRLQKTPVKEYKPDFNPLFHPTLQYSITPAEQGGYAGGH